MILSMTGFAAETADLPGVALAVELRSVNHRYLDVTVKLQEELRALESALRERIAAELKRGKVECRVGMARTTPGAATLAIDPGRVAQLAAAAAAVQKLAAGATPLSVAEILRWPVVVADATVPPDVLAAKVHELIGLALSAISLRTCAAPCQSISSSTSCPDASCALSHVADVAYQLPWTCACSRNSPAALSALNLGSSTK